MCFTVGRAGTWRIGGLFRPLALIMLVVALLAPAGAARAATDALCAIQQGGCATSCCGCGGVPPALPACPPGFQAYDDYCLPACPAGWTRYPGSPGLCLPPCHHGCPEGYDPVPLPQCPDGFHRDIADPERCIPDPGLTLQRGDDCPEGMTLSPETRQCVPDCPPGTYLDEAGLCRGYYEKPCPQGYGRDPGTGRCLPPGDWPEGYDWVCLPACPDGTVRDVAHPTRCLPPPPRCPDGFISWHGRCVPDCVPGTQRDPYGYCVPERCPDGSYPDLRGRCLPPDCPPGFDSLRGQCLPSCPQGYGRDDDGRCLPPDEGCPAGTEEIGGRCLPDCPAGVTRDPRSLACLPPDDSCPQGQERIGTRCLPACPPGERRDERGQCACPKGTEDVQGQCLPRCREGLERDANGRCVCPEGSDFLKGRCVPACAEGLVRDGNGRCMPPLCPAGTERVRGRCLPACPESFVRDAKGRCQCPDGTRRSPSGFCETVDEQQPCPDGYRRDETGSCQPVRRLPGLCPAGFVYSKRQHKCLLELENLPENPPLLRPRQPGLQIEPGTLDQQPPPLKLRKLAPAEGGDGDAPALLEACPKGYARDGNGRCVKG